MALTNPQIAHINNLAEIARVLEAKYTLMELMNYQWAGVPNFDADITQAEIDAIPQFFEQNLEVADLQEINYIVANLLPLVAARLAQVVKVARL